MKIAFKRSSEDGELFDGCDLTDNPLYMRRLYSLSRDTVMRGLDFLQLANGNVITSELKVCTYQFVWNHEKGRFERAKYGSKSTRVRKLRVDGADMTPQKMEKSEHYDDLDEEEDLVDLHDSADDNNSVKVD